MHAHAHTQANKQRKKGMTGTSVNIAQFNTESVM